MIKSKPNEARASIATIRTPNKAYYCMQSFIKTKEGGLDIVWGVLITILFLADRGLLRRLKSSTHTL